MEVLAAGVDRGEQAAAGGFLPESRRSISINFSDTDLENRIVATPVPDLEEFGNLVEGEPQPLRGLDDAKGRDRDWS